MKKLFDAFCDHWIDVPQEEFTKPINYVMAKNGCFEVRDTPLGRMTVRTEKIPSLERELEEGAELRIPPIPGRILTTVLDFFRAVYQEKSGAEAFLQIFFDEREQEYFLFCPQQKVSAALVEFERSPELEAENLLVMDIHSHNSMPAFFSTTDDADEQEDRLYGVLGCVQQRIPDLAFRVGVAGRFVNLAGKSLFGPPEPALEWPREWLSRCQQSVSPRHIEWEFDELSGWRRSYARRLQDDAPGEVAQKATTRRTEEGGPSRHAPKRSWMRSTWRRRAKSWGAAWDDAFSKAGQWEEDVEIMTEPKRRWLWS